MRTSIALVAFALTTSASSAVWAQSTETSAKVAPPAEQMSEAEQRRRAKQQCDTMPGSQRSFCMNNLKRQWKEADQAAGAGAKGSAPANEAKYYNAAVVEANAKSMARDFAGAAAVWRAAIAANPQSKVMHRMHAGLAISLRQQGVAAYRDGEQPKYPAPGSTNDQIVAANAANRALDERKRAVAVPLIQEALAEAVTAATLSEAQSDRGADEAIGVELREGASLMYLLARDRILAAPRASIDLEAKWVRAWLAASPTLAESLVAKHGYPVAFALAVRDPAAGMALADELKVRTKGDAEGLVGYADTVIAAKLPATDPRRGQALGALVAAEPTVIEPGTATRLRKAKTALSAKP